MKDMFNEQGQNSRKMQVIIYGLIFILLFMISGSHRLYAVEEEINFSELSEINQLLVEYKREEAYDQLYVLYDALDYEETPELYLEVLSRIMLLEEYYWNYEGMVSSAIKLYELSDAKRLANYRMLSLLTLANIDYYNYDNDLSLEKLNDYIELQTTSKDATYVNEYYLGMAKLMMDEQDLEGSRELLYKAVENLGPSGYINKINVNVLNIIYSTISDTYYYEEDLVSAQESLKIIVRNEQDSEDYIYYSVLLAEYYIETGEALLAEQVFDTIIPLYEASSEMFKTVMPWNRLDMLEASIAYNNKNYQDAATLYKYAIENQNTYSIDDIQTDVDAQSELNAFQDTETKKQLTLYEQLQLSHDKIITFYQIGIFFSIVFVIMVLIAVVILIKQKKLLYHLSITDQLTNVYNRRHIFEEFDKTEVGKQCVALLDLDKFKDINDTFGHLVGDEVLKKVALTIQNAIRETDFIGRYGGEEFMIILSTDSIQEAVTITERIRKDVEELVWVHDGLNTSVSIGLVYSTTTHGDKLLKEADKQLYMAKENGRNRLVFSVI